MNTTPPFPPELWEQTPVAVQAYIRTLEARVVALEATVQHLLERLQQDSHHSSRPPSSDPPRALKQRPPPYAQWPQARWTTGPSGTDPGIRPRRERGRRGAYQAPAVLPLPPPLAGRGSPAIPASVV